MTWQNPRIMARVHLVCTCLWLLAAIPTVLWWRESILWVAFMSLWANVASHWACWQAARAELKTDEQS